LRAADVFLGCSQKVGQMASEWNDYPDLKQHLSALNDTYRLNILRLLAEQGEMTVGALVKALGRSQPLISFHLKFLRTTGLVQKSQRGRQAFYTLDAVQFARYQQLLSTVVLPAATRRRLSQVRARGGDIWGEPTPRHTCALCQHIPPISEEERSKMGKKVRAAIIGVGNCASSLVQGIEYYRDASETDFVPGLMHVNLGGYHIRDIEFSAAFDIDSTKVGKDLSEAIWAGQNNTLKFADVPMKNVPVHRGMTHDGLGKYLSQVITKAPGSTSDIVKILQDTGTDIVINYLPVGSETATKWYVEQILKAGCGFVNCIPVFIGREQYWRDRFEAEHLPIVGDDIKSQVGATIVHRTLARLFRERGVRLERTMQLNVGGNTDFLNMLERERLESKKISKTNSVTSQLDYDIGAANVHIGPSDYVQWLSDRKWAYIRLEGRTFGDVPLNLELKLEVWDSPNSAGVVIDAVRCAKLAKDNGVGGALLGPSSYFMKSPAVQYTDDQARALVEQFIQQYGQKADAAPNGNGHVETPELSETPAE
jgi:myo-inositol-1-phosphate synthase